MKKDSLQVRAFSSPRLWRTWLEKNHVSSPGIWLRIYKAASRRKSVTYDEALDEALCFGWIDGQKNAFDQDSWIQRFTHRRPRSGWSQRNTQHVARLLAAGKMSSEGLREVEAAKQDGRWQQAYAPAGQVKIPPDFLRALQQNPQAKTFFRSLDKANTYAIAYRLQTAKRPATRERRLQMILAMLARGEKFHW